MLTDSGSLYVPGEQGRQTVAPVTATKSPLTHLVQVELPLRSAYFPSSQTSQTAEGDEPEKVPYGQKTSEEEDGRKRRSRERSRRE